MIENNAEVNSELRKNMITYLYKASVQLPNSLNILKSFLSSKFRILEANGNVCLPLNKNKAFDRCPRCCLLLREGSSQYKITPEVQISKFGRKLLDKVKRNQQLTSYQLKYLKRIRNDSQNQLVVTCKFCKNEVSYPICKPGKMVKKPEKTKNVKKSKKKKKDKLCGLNPNAIAEVQKVQKVEAFQTNTFIPLNANVNKKSSNARSNNKLHTQIKSKLINKVKQKKRNKLKDALENYKSPVTTYALPNFLHTIK